MNAFHRARALVSDLALIPYMWRAAVAEARRKVEADKELVKVRQRLAARYPGHYHPSGFYPRGSNL